eukprot:TRINITY_DN1835_c0_g1_i12.p1 TRINITY_DN1835_c0_g1~~TRINITY_DN1835_c0_g1_i12.p1  ORF type:complete len:576 (-),score=190.46 TRINITY_DN1835_c0_g1_i12:66-1793(-)
MAAPTAATTLASLLGTATRDYVIGKGGAHVPIAEVASSSQVVGLYFSAHWCGPCRGFTPRLAAVYKEIRDAGNRFQIVFVSSDSDEAAFNEYFGEMPWLALPYADRETKDSLSKKYDVKGIPSLVMVDSTGNELMRNARGAVAQFGAKAWPFVQSQIDEMAARIEREKAEALAKSSFASLLKTPTRDWLLDKNGNHVPIATLEAAAAPVLLYLSTSEAPPHKQFVDLATKAYNELRAAPGKPIEIVYVPADPDEQAFTQHRALMPWLSLPYEKEAADRIRTILDVPRPLWLAALDGAGRIVNNESALMALVNLGAEAYPFTREQIAKVTKEKEERKKQAIADQNLELLLVTNQRDFVVKGGGAHVPVASLHDSVMVGIYFSGHWCGPCRGFTPKLAAAYNKINATAPTAAGKKKNLEIVFSSSDKEVAAFNEYFAEMPWLALPYEDRDTSKKLSEHFDVEGIPTLVLLDGTTGKTVEPEGVEAVSTYGAEGFPWDAAAKAKADAAAEAKMDALPKWVKIDRHEHPLHLLKCGRFGCDVCRDPGSGWSYRCVKCDFDAHPATCVAGATPVPEPAST